jgi:IMP dehydrogenase
MVKLIAKDELQSKFDAVKKSLETVYHIGLGHRAERLEVDSLIPTIPFLEEDKLHLVMEKVMKEGYNVPVISLEHKGKFYIIDGHHRTYTFYVLNKKWIDSLVLEFPEDEEYRAVEEIRLGKMEVKSIGKPQTGSVAKDADETWERAGRMALYFEKIHGVEFTVVSKDVEVNRLVPTQPHVNLSGAKDRMDRNLPIICVECREKSYIVDGHDLAAVAHRDGTEKLNALILVPQQPIDFGMSETAKRWGLESLNDLKVK